MSETGKALAGRLEPTPARFLATRRADIHTTSLVSQFGFANRQLNSAVRALLLRARLNVGATAVDFGCADRPYATFLPAGVKYVGADLRGNPQADVEIGSDGTLPIPPETIDLVLSTQVLEHVEDPGAYLAECARVLRPGGKLLLSTHGIMYYHPDPEDYWRWTCAGIRRILADHGFEVVESKGVLGLLAASLQLIQDRIAWRLPRYVRRLFVVAMQILIALGDRVDKEESKSTNSWTIAVLASKVSRVTSPAEAAHDDPIVICLTFDSNYIAPAATLIRSCLLHQDSHILRFEVLHDGSLSGDDQRQLERMCEQSAASIRFNIMDESRLRGLPAVDRFGSIVWWRLFLPDLLPDVDRLLYLDCDTLVLSSLVPLWQEDLGAFSLAAVANVIEPEMRPHVAGLGIGYPGGFFNAGVLLLQLDRMRDEGSVEALVDFAVRNQQNLPWNDQDALNVVFADRWHPLHPRWNAQNNLWSWRDWAIEVFGQGLLDEAVERPTIRHFEGPTVAKPWHYLCPVPHRGAYLQMLAQTPWAKTPLEGRTASTMAIRLLPERWRLDVYGHVAALKSAARGRVTQ